MSRKLDELPDILTAGELATFLSISKRKAYELMDISEDVGGIPCLQFGRNKRVEKADLQSWLNNNKK
jgi:excisionase family DNA binding protein